MHHDGITLVFLTQGKVAIIDSADAHWVLRDKWCFDSDAYAVRGRQPKGSGGLIRMHREILQAPTGIEGDHINGNGLDNRRSNLRLATSLQNKYNRGAKRNGTSGYKGVSFDRSRQRWMAHIKINGKFKNLGRFADQATAARAYDAAAIVAFGEFARLNFPDH